jgi:UDP-GlcNAc3NAcA epimerase
MKYKVMTVVGARPQFVKTCALSRVFRENGRFHEIIVHTGQHYDRMLSGVFFDELGIPMPDYNLGVGSSSAGAQTGRMIEKLEKVMLAERPALAIVPGDTNSTLAGALAAAKLKIPVAHVEAGMRCGDPFMPEEINRKAADHVSTLFFCPTETAVENLRREGIFDNVHLTGDVMADAFHMFQPAAVERSDILKKLHVNTGEYCLLTVHRAENTDDPGRLRAILEGCGKATAMFVFPVHPRTRNAIGAGFELPVNIKVVNPVSYEDMLSLETGARTIVTDSGGVQKEAYLSGVPCVTLRETTEWPETVEAGWNKLVGAVSDAIADAVENFRPDCNRKPIFGPAGAAGRIVSVIDEFLGKV